MSKLKAFGLFWYDFIIGDDWRVAAAVAGGLAVTALVVHVAGVNAWWLLPLCIVAALAWSLHRATSRRPLRVSGLVAGGDGGGRVLGVAMAAGPVQQPLEGDVPGGPAHLGVSGVL